MFHRKSDETAQPDETAGPGGPDASDGLDGPGGPHAPRDAGAARDEAQDGDRFAAGDEEPPPSAARAAQEARPDRTRPRSARTATGELYGERERLVRRERALSRERDLREATHTGTGDSGAARTPPAAGAGRTGLDKDAPAVSDGRLLPRSESEEFGRRLHGALTHFVDDPGQSVEEAAAVLEETARRLAAALEERPRALRADWDTGARGGGTDAKGADTERLRLALRAYRETTERLLAM
ncbi:hypothetical protein [Streptomyces sp. 8L]|uniref:hypothetical protein n=1 Tax=Streptomyces sp. 8L TaxID=2877242 RepID=UPI001CD7FD3B|nr:hypothetical protein [Streptomyces sp. 8L]MCA1224348.1 hypothetical protein [Streptomyces sp. 8L]